MRRQECFTLTLGLACCVVAGCEEEPSGPVGRPGEIKRLSPAEFAELASAMPSLEVLDVRTPHEFEGGHIPGAKNIDIQDEAFRNKVSKLERDKPYVVHCAAGSPNGRSTKAARTLASLGFSKVYHLDGGYLGWQKAANAGNPQLGSKRRMIGEKKSARPHYLEIVTDKREETCSLLEQTLGMTFDQPAEAVGGARIATLANESLLGVRAPLREDERPVSRIYWRVKDLAAAIASARKAGAEVAIDKMPIGDRGHIGIVILGGIEHGYWQP